MKFTEQQRRAIEHGDGSLTVSAAAGSGKTAVLAQRVVHLVCGDGATGEPCTVDRLLVVTFTNDAARQMRDRIGRALRERLDLETRAGNKPLADHLTRQLALLPAASINTLHGYCGQLIRRFFHALSVDPGYNQLDNDESRLIQRDVARRLFDDRYEAEEDAQDAPFSRFVDAYADGYDTILIDKLLRARAALASLADPQAWTHYQLEKLQRAAADFPDGELADDLRALLADELAALHDEAQTLARHCSAAGLDSYTTHLQELAASLETWRAMLLDDGIDALRASWDAYTKGKLPTVKTADAPPEKETLQKAINKLKARVKDEGTLRILRFTRDEFRAGLRLAADAAGQFLDLVDEFETRYRQAKANVRGLDFNDLERLALRLLLDANSSPSDPQPSTVAKLLQRRYTHVLVDEVQDINELQDTLLRLVGREAFDPADMAGPPGLFRVGDVKQSIYRFRLADPRMFMRLLEPGGPKTQELPHNFRSRKALLDALNDLFERLFVGGPTGIDYTAGHALEAGKLDYPDTADTFAGSPVEIHVLPDELTSHDGSDQESGEDADEIESNRAEREAAFIASQIRTMLGDDGSPPRLVLDPETDELRPIRLSDIAILLRTRARTAEQFARQLRRRDIPTRSDAGTGFFEAQEVRDVMALLSLLDNRRQDLPLAAVLRSPLVTLATEDESAEDALARIRLHARDARQDVSFHEAVDLFVTANLNDPRDRAAQSLLRDALARLDEWRHLAHRRPLAELVWHIFDDSGLLAYVAGLTDGRQREANLLELHRRAAQFDTFQRQGVGNFVEFLRRLEAEGELGLPDVADDADVVRVVSIHRSKGLEFPVVFLADANKSHNLIDASGALLFDRTAGLGVEAVDLEKSIRYPTAASAVVAHAIRRESLAEELRVLYVALTRAREHLVVVGSTKKEPRQQVELWQRASAGQSRLSCATVMGCSSMLQWLVTAATSSERWQVFTHEPATVTQWVQQLGGARHHGRDAVDKKMRDLLPLGSVSEDGQASEIIRRMIQPYEFEPFAHLAAAATVTELAKAHADEPVDLFTSVGAPMSRVDGLGRLHLPRCRRDGDGLTALDIGEATHEVLRLLDFPSAATAENVREQIASMVERRMLHESAAKRVDVDSVVWAASAVLDLAREADRTHRELPVHVPIDPRDVQPDAPIPIDERDRVMLRGRIDFVAETPAGLVLVDYKTDRTDRGRLDSLVDRYAPQLRQYADALATITNQPIAGCYLLFLHAHQSERVA